MRCTDLSVSFLNLKIRKKRKKKKKTRKEGSWRSIIFLQCLYLKIFLNDFNERFRGGLLYIYLNEERYITEEHFAKRIRGLN